MVALSPPWLLGVVDLMARSMRAKSNKPFEALPCPYVLLLSSVMVRIFGVRPVLVPLSEDPSLGGGPAGSSPASINIMEINT